jgi:hypothetical protein
LLARELEFTEGRASYRAENGPFPALPRFSQKFLKHFLKACHVVLVLQKVLALMMEMGNTYAHREGARVLETSSAFENAMGKRGWLGSWTPVPSLAAPMNLAQLISPTTGPPVMFRQLDNPRFQWRAKLDQRREHWCTDTGLVFSLSSENPIPFTLPL